MTILIFIVILVVLILSHEFGHFLFAKLSKVKVEEFGFGFPPRIFCFKKNETVYSFNLFPIGGFVKILGEDGPGNTGQDAPVKSNFAFKPVYIKAAIISAGVFFNLILAWILFSVGFFVGAPTQVDDETEIFGVQVVITEVAANSPAENAGLAPGDRIVGFRTDNKGIEISTIGEVQSFVKEREGEKINILYNRGGEEFSADVVPRIGPPEGEGALGIAMARVGILKSSWYASIWLGLKETIFLAFIIAQAFFYLMAGIFKGVGFDEVSGPVGIFNIVSDVSQMGIIYLIRFAAVLSINLAVINIIPFPALDGGRLLFLAIEKIKGSPVNYKIANFAHGLGFVLLIILLILLTYNDFLRF